MQTIGYLLPLWKTHLASKGFWNPPPTLPQTLLFQSNVRIFLIRPQPSFSLKRHRHLCSQLIQRGATMTSSYLWVFSRLGSCLPLTPIRPHNLIKWMWKLTLLFLEDTPSGVGFLPDRHVRLVEFTFSETYHFFRNTKTKTVWRGEIPVFGTSLTQFKLLTHIASGLLSQTDPLIKLSPSFATWRDSSSGIVAVIIPISRNWLVWLICIIQWLFVFKRCNCEVENFCSPSDTNPF